MSKNQIKQLPCSPEAEMSVLGAVLFDNNALLKVKKIIGPDAFHNTNNQNIFAAMLEISKNGGAIEPIRLIETLENNGTVGNIKTAYMQELIDCTPTATTAIHHAKIVQEKFNQRKVIAATNEALLNAQNGKQNSEEIINKLQNNIDSIKRGIRNSKEKQIFSALDFKKEIEAIHRGEEEESYKPGWFNLDKFYRIVLGEWTLLTGIPGHGKSGFLDCMQINLATNYEDWKVAFFSPENHRYEKKHIPNLIKKLSGHNLKPQYSNQIEKKALDYWMSFLDEHVRHIWSENNNNTIDNILDLAEEAINDFGIKGLVIDPWNELEHNKPKHQSETEYISDSLSRIRRFAAKHNIHIWLIGHPIKMKTNEKTGKYKVPTPYDVSGSAHFRNKADNCLAIWRDVDDLNNIEPVQIHIQKIRFSENGRLGKVKLRFDEVTGGYLDL